MAERKTGGWLSSVVGNISGLWSRSPAESAVTSREAIDSRNSSRNTSYEEQGESDVGEEDDGIIVETVCAGPSVTVPTTSTTQNDTPKRHAVRYLSPSTLLSSTRSVTTSSSKEKLTNITRKRTAPNCLFQDDIMWSNIGNTFATSSMVEPPSARFSSKRSKIQRDFSDERSFLSLSSLSDAPPTVRSHLNQSFASSFTPLNSLAKKSKVSRSSSSAASSLSSKTRAILEQLEKISSPVKEVKRLSSLNLNGPERWANDAISSAVQKPPRNSACALSRAQLISNILASKSSLPFWSRPAQSAKLVDSSSASSDTVKAPECSRADTDHEREFDKVSTTKSSGLLSPKKADFVSSSRKSDRQKDFVDDNMEKSTMSLKVAALPVSTSVIKTADTVLPQRSSSTKSTNVFSAKDLGVVSPMKEIVGKDNDEKASPTKIDGAMFAFAPPMKRGPSASFYREEVFSKVHRSTASFTEVTFKAATEKTVDGFAFPAENVSKKIEGPSAVFFTGLKNFADQSNTADTGKETQPVAEVPKSVKPTDASTAMSNTLSMNQPSHKSAEQWPCSKCMVFNKADTEKCVCCGHENHLVEAKPWTCSECWISNKSADDKCAACGNLKQSNGKSVKLADISAQSSSSTNVFGDRTFKPLPSSGGISFGFSAAKPIADGASLSSTTSAPRTAKVLNSGTVVNGNANAEVPLKFGLSSSTLVPSFGFGKAPEINSLPTVTKEQPSVLSSSHPPSSSLAFGVSSGSSETTASFVPALTRSSFSFPTLTTTTSTTTALPPSISTFSIPVPTNVNPFTFGSSNTTTAEEIKAPTAPLFTFGSSTAFPAITTGTSAVTTATPSPSFGTSLPEFSAPKAPLFGTSSGTASSPGGGHDVVEMSSPTTSPIAPSAVGSFGMSKSSAPPLFNFGASNASSSTSTGTLFGNLQTTVQNPLAAPSTSLFSFGQQQTPVAPKPFEPPTSLPSPPSTFNFGAAASNGAAGFVFGSTSPPTNFTFGAQQPVNNAASTTFNFTPATPASPFGNVPGSALTPNYFSVGSTSSTTARKIIKARRIRKS
uniref:RanBP2-type domain-containing protein n=1 Tax=Elaeophora elaphi TaxID=1147741 RepID=A0A0R3RPF5_9BILA